MNIASLVLEAVGVFIAVATLFYTVFSAWRKSQERKLQTAIAALTKEMDEERQHRIDNINRLHARIDQVQTDLISDLQGRMSRMEGELKGMTNILSQIQGWFIDQANKKG